MASGTPQPTVERADFDGVLIAVLSYGALLMLYIQLLRVLLTRPKRGKVFWGITIYSGILFTLASIAAGGKIKFAEYVYVGSRLDGSTDLPSKISGDHASMTINVMSRICTTMSPWFSDMFMIYRVMVIWGYKWWLLMIPVPIYFAHISMSIPFLIADTRPNNTSWASKSELYGIVFHTLCVSLNISFSVLITVKLLTMRKKLEIALGRLHASFYTSKFTILVESGAFATLWGIVYLATAAQKHWTQNVFLQPYYYVIAITRMLIVLRMAQNRAWCKDTVTAVNAGVMDWEVSSAHSIPLSIAPPQDENSLKQIMSPDSSTTSAHTLN
ncbi:hypothetical protein P691DRAFT_666781 [Macrolepiota fuliginosa MF-IS2]|uniref:Uncharacterized protein n=1 Tax=Macrolepiota fuliginosa MF-IS2 TaxID=1400762 RepID=A0A9P6C629_9AGAR|nr:hypothetical protein P691DRAFT_666781 [Macrolepiota fuliginosa MF-IS2]